MIAAYRMAMRRFATLSMSATCGLTFFLASPICEAATQRRDILTCEFEQVLLFGDNPSDYPSGPAYFGSSQPLTAANPDNYNFTDNEAEHVDTGNEMVRKYRGAQFTVDLRDGMLKSTPFGSKGFLIIQFPHEEQTTPVLLTKDINQIYNGYAFIAYSLPKSLNYNAILMLSPPMIDFSRTFEYMGRGETLIGYCH